MTMRHPTYKTDDQRRRAFRRQNLLSYHRRARRREEAGLTTRGTPRKNRPALPPHKQLAAARTAALSRYYANREQHLAAGLTTTGRARRRHLWTIPSPAERAWRKLRAEMDLAATRRELLAELPRSPRDPAANSPA